MNPKYCSECGAKLPNGAKFCAKCGSPAKVELSNSDEIYEPSNNEIKTPAKAERQLVLTKKEKKLVGLSGWLVIFIIGLFASLLYSGYYILVDFGAISSYNLTSLAYVFLIELVINLLLFVFALLSIINILKYKRIGRTLAILFMVSVIIGSIINLGLVNVISDQLVDSTTIISDQSSQVGRAIVYGCIWIPYFLISKRVKLTLRK